MNHAESQIRRVARNLPLILLLTVIPSALPPGLLHIGTVSPVHATTTTALSLWNPAYKSRAVVNSSLPATSQLQFNVNVTGTSILNAFDITVGWDPAVLNATSATYRGGIFDTPDFRPFTKNVAPNHVEMSGILLGALVAGNGTIFNFNLKVLRVGSSSVFINATATTLKGLVGGGPGTVPYVPLNGFFSNQPGVGDLMVASVGVPSETIPVGRQVGVSVGLRNMGSISMAGVNVTLYANNAKVNSTIVGTMLPNTFSMVTLAWNTTKYSPGVYILNATVTTTSADAFPADNSLAVERVTLVIHDLAVMAVKAPSSALVNTTTTQIDVVVRNLGTVQDIANVSITANNTLIRIAHLPSCCNTYQLQAIDPAQNVTFQFFWNTTGVQPGRYQLKAMVKPVPDEANTTNDMLSGGIITIQKYFDYDLAVTGYLPAQATVGANVTITVTVMNNGLNAENYTLNVLLSGRSILNKTRPPLPPRTSEMVSVVWKTAGYAIGTYLLAVNVTTTLDQNPSNNMITSFFQLSPLLPPIAQFNFAPKVPQPRANVLFNATSSFDPQGLTLDYSWNFGDGSTGTGQKPGHAYSSPGTYNVTLTVTDVLGATASLTEKIRINAPPAATFRTSTDNPLAGTEITFDASASSDTDGTIASYAWDFGDGSRGTGGIVKHTFSSAGTYEVKLNVTDNDGGNSQYSLTLSVKAQAAPLQAAYLGAIGGVGAAAAAAGFLFYRRRRSLRSSAPTT